MLAREFTIFNMPFQVSRARENYVEIRNEFSQLAKHLVIEFENIYHKENKNIDDVHENVLYQGGEILLTAIDEAIEILLENKIYEIDRNNFWDNYYVKKYCTWFDYFEIIDNKYLDIVEATTERDAYRTSRRQNRSRWEGGGFGLSGSLQGAATAGALNMASGAIHGVVNLGAKAISSIGDSIKKSNLFNDETTLNTLKKGIKENVENIGFALMDILRDNKVATFDKITKADEEKVKAILNNIAQVNENERKKLIIQMLELNPYNIEIYEYVIWQNIDLNFNIVSIAEYFQINIALIIEKILLNYFNEADIEKEEDAKLIKQTIITTMTNYHMKESEALNKIDKILTDIDIQKRTFKNYLYNTREEKEIAIKQEEELKILCSNIDNIDRLELTKLLQLIIERKYIGNVAEEYINKIKTNLQKVESEVLNKICKNLNYITEEECNTLKEKIIELNFSEEVNKQYLIKVDNRIDTIWKEQENIIFDKIYLNTDIRNQKNINNSLMQIKEKGRTTCKENYIKALEAINEKNIKRTRNYLLLTEKGWLKKFYKEFILLFITLYVIDAFPEIDEAILGYIMIFTFFYPIYSIIKTIKSKKIYNIITLKGQLIHPQILEDKVIYNRINKIFEDKYFFNILNKNANKRS